MMSSISLFDVLCITMRQNKIRGKRRIGTKTFVSVAVIIVCTGKVFRIVYLASIACILCRTHNIKVFGVGRIYNWIASRRHICIHRWIRLMSRNNDIPTQCNFFHHCVFARVYFLAVLATFIQQFSAYAFAVTKVPSLCKYDRRCFYLRDGNKWHTHTYTKLIRPMIRTTFFVCLFAIDWLD